MLASIHLVVFEVIVTLKLGVASSHRVCSFQQVVAKESVTGFNHAGVLRFEIAGLMLCPHKAGILGNGSLRLETVDVADLGDDPGGVDFANARNGGKRVGDDLKLLLNGFLQRLDLLLHKLDSLDEIIPRSANDFGLLVGSDGVEQIYQL